MDCLSRVTSGTQLASMPMMVLESMRFVREVKKATLSAGSAGAYTLAMRRMWPWIRVSHAMPRPSGRARMVLLTLASASWCDSRGLVSSCPFGMRMAVPPLGVRELSGTANI